MISHGRAAIVAIVLLGALADVRSVRSARERAVSALHESTAPALAPPVPALERDLPPPLTHNTPPDYSTAAFRRTTDQEWGTYTDEKHNFRISYPKEGWTFMPGQGAPPPEAYAPVSPPVNLYTQRTPPEGVLISIAVFEGPEDSRRSLSHWLVSGYFAAEAKPSRTMIEDIVKRGGDISTALARAYAGQTGLLTFRATEKNSEPVYEVGAVRIRGKLLYATFFTRKSLVYSASLDLPLNQPPGVFKDADSGFVGTYTHMVSTFAFLH
jgi:hypothetical protein